MFARPAVLFENVLDLDQRAGIRGDMESNGVSSGFGGELFASAAAVAKIANLPGARFIRLRGVFWRPALARKSVAERRSRRHAPGAALESRHWKKIRACHCPV